MGENKLLYNMDISGSLIEIVNMVKVDFASLVSNPPGASLVAKVVSPSSTPMNPTVWVDQESIAAGASYQHNAARVRGSVEGAHRVTADIIVSRQ